MKLITALSAFALFTALVPAQACTLSVTGTGAPGTDLVFAAHGAASSFAVVAIGQTQGTTNVPFLHLQLGLAEPFIVLPLGRTDANGDVSRTFTVPSRLTTQHNVFGQGIVVTVQFQPFSISGCATNVVPFTVG